MAEPTSGAAGAAWRGAVAAGNIGRSNRGLAILDDGILCTTTDAHLLCLNRLTGGLTWDVNMRDQDSTRWGTVVTDCLSSFLQEVP